jgi:cysteine desulfurase/selenocysteine lyase
MNTVQSSTNTPTSKPTHQVELHQELDLRADFPIFHSHPELIYLDSGASAQKPRLVINSMTQFLEGSYANVHRGVYQLSADATMQFESARNTVKEFLGAKNSSEIIFTKGATEGINLVAYSWGRTFLKKGDEVILSIAEHHSNIVPWLLLSQEIGFSLQYVGLDQNEDFSYDDFLQKLSPRTKLVALTGLSNVLGFVTPLKKIIKQAHQVGAIVLVDACQLIPHHQVNVQDLDCDFLTFSGHKLYGPTGIGVLYGKETLLEKMPPFLGGGDMIRSVSLNSVTFNELPHKFEAGTPAITEAIGLEAAINYVQSIGFEKIEAHELMLAKKFEAILAKFPRIRTLGPSSSTTARQGILSFSIEGIHPHDIAQFMSSKNIAIRAGHHCAQPLITHLDLQATARVSLGLYNSSDDAVAFSDACDEMFKFFK